MPSLLNACYKLTGPGIGHHEVQGSDIRRYRHVAIVREDDERIGRLAKGCGDGGRLGGARGEEKKDPPPDPSRKGGE